MHYSQFESYPDDDLQLAGPYFENDDMVYQEVDPSSLTHEIQPDKSLSYDVYFLDKCLAQGDVYFVVDTIDEWLNALDHKVLANKLMEYGLYGLIADNLEKFTNGSVAHTALAEFIMATRFEDALANNLEKMRSRSVDHALLYRRLVDGGHLGAIVNNIRKFNPRSVDVRELRQMLIDSGLEIYIDTNPDLFNPPLES